MNHYTLDDLKKIFPSKTDQELVDALSKGVLKLSQPEIETVSFIFFLSHIAERDMDHVLTSPWKVLAQIGTPEQIKIAKGILNAHMTKNKFTEPPLEEVLKEIPSGQAEKIRAVVENRYRDKSSLNIDKLETFGDKILAYEAIKSKNNVSRILWQLKQLRDDISHGRIKELTYEKQSLMKREVKEKLFFDYMSAVSEPEHEKSGLEEALGATWSEEEDQTINGKAKDLLRRI
ncbi:MAG: hypothetical protein V4665_04440 [Patescibacteria group bacterium]